MSRKTELSLINHLVLLSCFVFEGLIFAGGKFSLQNWPDLYWEGNLPFKIDWASL